VPKRPPVRLVRRSMVGQEESPIAGKLLFREGTSAMRYHPRRPCYLMEEET